jgi:leader peptidase (prepilin peptidase)/N-methyltransferase
MVEIAAAILAIWVVLLTNGVITILSCALMLWLLCLSVVDTRTYLLPDVMTLPLIPIGLLVVYLLSPGELPSHVIGAVMGWGIFALVGLFFVKFRGQIGLGGGDAKLLAGAGAWLGWQALPSVIVIAAIAGLAFAAALVIIGKTVQRTTPIPFGPFLAVAFLGVWLHGPLLLI